MTEILLSGLLMGLLATLAMDLWALALNRFAGQPLPNWAMPGRWVAHLPRGKVFHDDIADAAPVSGELQMGWGLHYGVGIVYGVALAAIMGADWLTDPTFLPAWIFSILMVGFGWFLLQPGLGLGWAASKTPNPWMVRAMNLVAHTVFAVGLWVGALV
ncbi:DUF2938 family protein [Alphaproteobacteria bacterium GH1-50]|uniref:DUF2938 family protein n=1 Tax=Kangsaoukella pontilimi TaxID=2691042 RepID=A0A7C9MQB5_9RHOB|nr:DUF2938 domain-containing protein [Kangsaoukella pontilimi]MXQ07257.1 DUF2938 family protein [Kangsaoukella pontilimi]